MEIKKEKLVSVADEIICDCCKTSCKREPAGGVGSCEFGTLQATWGYWSKQDLTSEECHLCENCFDKVRDFITGLGGKVRKKEYHLCV